MSNVSVGRAKLSCVDFSNRHLGPDAHGRAVMLAALGYASTAALADAAVPPEIRCGPLGLPDPLTEPEATAKLRDYAGRNVARTQMIGQGFYPSHTPAVIRRNVLENPGWYTSYTPYQPEISQGRLELLMVFQTMVEDLTGLPVANASLLDEASAVSEAVMLLHRVSKAKGPIVLDADLFPQCLSVATGRAAALGIPVVVADCSAGLPDGELAGLVLAYPGDSGEVRDLRAVIADAKARGAMVAVSADLLALTLLTPPGELGADVALGSTQRFGLPLFFGGPHAAYLAVRDGLVRQLPGRLVGLSRDAAGRPAYRLALQTREQHIRRERATSNICTAQALPAVLAACFAVWHGAEGLAAIARQVHGHAVALATELAGRGHQLACSSFFDTVRVQVPGRAVDVVAAAERRGVNLRLVDADTVAVACSETTTAADLDLVVAAVTQAAPTPGPGDVPGFGLPDALLRRSEYLTHPVFREYRTETAMMRYLRRLADRDLALDRSMIPLGSCTMKLTAAAEIEPMSWPEFASIHPYAPANQTAGWQALIAELEGWLLKVTGYRAISLQPNAGSQGELAGLLAIRGYLHARGDDQRRVCLIPESAHGTNAASAQLAGLRVVTVKNDADGSIDAADLSAKVDRHRDELAAIMITYPSTYGVFDADVREICDQVHAAGGQVYIDGANLNALLGLARLGEFGGDVSHINLHKTFAIPHGGGGPGVGPVCVAEHLAPYLPGDPNATPAPDRIPVAATLHGSAGVLPISWAFIAMTGGDGLRACAENALLSANWLANQLDDAFPVLYRGANGLVAHECILDVRAVKHDTGVSAEDVAKRLVDFGFHAPTLSFPVHETLMVEPTESEALGELQRFVDAMRTIRAEIDRVAAGEWELAESTLARAPHTLTDLLGDWDRPYTRTEAVRPVQARQSDTYLPPVGRINNAYGDRNLVCSCPPVADYAEQETSE